MTAPLLVDGKPLSLGERIGKGGEGEVFALRDSADLALKVFTGGNAAPREAKVVAMIRAGLAQSTALVAYPRAIVRKEGGQFAGFLMRKITGHKPLFDLYAPAARRAAFPKADYRFLVAAATNVARAVATVHRSGCVIGDINHSGILIAGDARAALIDADSFQVSADGKQYPCLVGVPEYTPPEILGLKLSTVVRTPNHDCFGLAVVVFQLLFMGRHPFAGSYVKGEMPIEKAIKEFRFAYSQRRSVGMKPPPGASSLPDVPPAVRDAFEAAFAPETVERRPTAENWVALLEQLSATLRVCAVNNRHHYSASASECPWCRMERALGGVLLFLPPELIFNAGTAPTFDPSESGFNLAVVWAAIEAVRAPALPPAPVLPQINLKPSAEVHAAKRAKLKRRIGGFAFAAAGLAIVAAAPGYWVAWGGMIAWGLYLAFGQIQADGAFVRRYVDATQGLERAYHAWRANVAATEFEVLRLNLKNARLDLEGLAVEERDLLAAYERERQSAQRDAFLERFQIGQFKINGIGPARLALLASYGIETAADVTEARVLQVPGLGRVNATPLFEWRKARERQFVFSAQATPADINAQRKIKASIATEARELRSFLAEGPQKLSQLASQIAARAARPDPDIMRLNVQKQQAAANLVALGIALPTVPAVSPPTPAALRPTRPRRQSSLAKVPTPAARSASTTNPQCPVCQSAMKRRRASRGRRAGSYFWGCVRYPQCRGTRPI